MTMGHREKLKSHDEINVFTAWRHFIPRFDRAGETKKVKRLFNRRIRRNSTQHLMDEVE